MSEKNLQENKLIGILQTFSEGEMKTFRNFLSSGLVSVSLQTMKFFDRLYSLHPQFNSQELHKEKIFVWCFPGKGYEDKKLRYLITDLTRCCDSYIAFASIQKQKQLKQTILSKAYAERNCRKAYNSILIDSRKNQTEIRDASFYYTRFEDEFTFMEYAAINNSRGTDNNIVEVTNYLDKFYLVKKLQLLCEIQNVKNVMSKEHKVLLFDEIMEHLRKHTYSDDPAISIYYRILMTLIESNDEKHFMLLQDLLLKHGRCFQHAELRDMYQYVLNYCIKKINTGDTKYQRTIFEVYKVILSNGIILVKNRLSQWDFKNIVTISLRLGELHWCYKFINSYKESIPAKDRENAYNYNIAFWHFYKKEYSRTLNLLQRVNFTDLYYQLDSRVIILKIYVEQNDDEALFYHLSAFRTFIDRNKLISDYQRIIYKNLIKFTSSMVKSAGNRKKIEDLKKKISENKQVADLQWLLKQVNAQ